MEFLESYIGGFGRMQFFLFVVYALTDIPAAMMTYVMTFYAPDVNFWCARPDGIKAQVSPEEWMNYSSPLVEVKGERVRSRCEVYDWAYDNISVAELVHLHGNKTEKCHRWEFDTGMYHRTMREEFDLVCSRDILISLSDSLYMVGIFFGVLVNGYLADRYGRRKVILLTAAGTVLTTSLMIFSQTFIMFLVLVVIQMFCRIGTATTEFVLFTEMCSQKYRAIMGNFMGIGFAVGMTAFAGIAYLLLDWVHIQIVIAASFLLFSLLYWFVPESPRWLISRGRTEEAVQVILRTARINKMQIEDKTELETVVKDLYQSEAADKADIVNYSILDLLKPVNLRKKTLNLFFCWTVNAFIYYALSFNTNNLGGNPFINFFVASAVEIPAYIASGYVMNCFGRRWPITVCMVVGGISCGTQIVIPKADTTLFIAFQMIGKFFITCSFSMVYITSAEIFPTVVRSTGLGACSMVARIGAVVAPFVKELENYTSVKVPPAIYAALSVTSGLLILLLPETHNSIPPDTIEQSEKVK